MYAIRSYYGIGLANWFFGLVFAATAATIVSGGVAERIKFKSYLLMSIVITAVLYPLFVYLGPWGSGMIPFNDYAGSFIVHGLGGFLALGAIMALGPRIVITSYSIHYTKLYEWTY